MPTILTHALVPLLGQYAARGRFSRRLVAAGVIVAMLPDADVVSFAFGIPYGSDFGHRGASHSLAAAVLLGLVAASMAPALRSSRLSAFLFVGASGASHGLTDMLTNGGRGVALFWPASDARLFWPVTPVQVSPIGPGFFSGEGFSVLISELIWIIVPLVLIAILVRLGGRSDIDLSRAET
jgi:inner membrane protein